MAKAKQELIDAGWINDRTYHTCNIDDNGVPQYSLGVTRVYQAWHHMKQRCTNAKYREKRPTYIGVTASDEFKNFTKFHEWWYKQIGHDFPNIALDKDLLIKGNKLYSSETCLLVPHFVNTFLTKNDATRGDCLVGVCKKGKYENGDNKYVAQINDYDYNSQKTVQKHLGCFRCELEAFHTYRREKEAIAKRHATCLRGKVDERVVQALLDFEVNIDD